MDKETIEALLSKLDGTGSDREYQAVKDLRSLGARLPGLLLEKYRRSKKWQVRSAFVYQAVRYANEVEDAYQLGLEALVDRSKVVRYQACALLANSLRKDAIPALEEMALNVTDSESVENARAAIDAIENQNVNYFVDRDHSGKMTLVIH